MYELQGEKKDSVHFGTVADSGSGCSSMHSDDDRSGNIVDRNDTRYFGDRVLLPIHRKKYKKVVHLPQTDAPDILPIQTK